MIPWFDLEIAFCNAAPGFHRFLDRAMGRVVNVQIHVLASITTLQWITAETGRFLRIRQITSRDQHGWMLRFIASVEDPELRGRLEAAIIGVGAFQRYKQILRGAPSERQRWLDLRSQLVREHIEAWLISYGVTESEGLPQASEASESPEPLVGEAELRNLARQQLEILPAHTLASAVGFLRYLEGKSR
jgi:hypothetical protein